MQDSVYDVIVIGGGHAGCEAATSAARAGARTMLMTHSCNTIGEMSCNPAFGGIGKGTLVKEVDALDGIMGVCADRAGIHFRELNQRKGPAVRGPRAQADRNLYKRAMLAMLRSYPLLEIAEGEVEDISVPSSPGGLFEVLATSGPLFAKSVVVTTGTFLNGLICRGNETIESGRIGEAPSKKLASALLRHGLKLGRMKTGTPARIDASTIDWSLCKTQPTDEIKVPFSFAHRSVYNKQIHCYISSTTAKTHDIIRKNFQLSARGANRVSSVGPRYCPSIEDKLLRFPDKEAHQVFLEPENIDISTIYPNGLSNSFPPQIQDEFMRTLPGLERAKIKQYGYVIEYDYIDPRQLDHTLQFKAIPGLFFAGQINGTTGYEEAAAQGLVAGLNAGFFTKGKSPFILPRSQSLIGVMIDDLVTVGVTEPYRMFNSRSEYRLTIRPDNADIRLTPLAIERGVCSSYRQCFFEDKMKRYSALLNMIKSLSTTPSALSRLGVVVNQDGVWRSLFSALSLPGVDLELLSRANPLLSPYIGDVVVNRLVCADALYDAYLGRQARDIELIHSEDSLSIPAQLPYRHYGCFSAEAAEKLERCAPRTIADAKRIPGLSKAHVLSLIMIVKGKVYAN